MGGLACPRFVWSWFHARLSHPTSSATTLLLLRKCTYMNGSTSIGLSLDSGLPGGGDPM